MAMTNETPSSANVTAQVSIGLASLQVVCKYIAMLVLYPLK